MHFTGDSVKRYIDRGRMRIASPKKAEVKPILGTMKEDGRNPCGGLRRLGCKFWKALDESGVFLARAKSFSASIGDVKPIQCAIKAGLFAGGRRVDGHVMAKLRVNFYADASENHEMELIKFREAKCEAYLRGFHEHGITICSRLGRKFPFRSAAEKY